MRCYHAIALVFGLSVLLSQVNLAQSPPPASGASAAAPNAGQGGGANADFDGLIDLIVSTVASETWAENGGGEAEIRPFEGGIHADAQGTLRRMQRPATATSLREELARVKAQAEKRTPTSETDARNSAKLRCVSLVRLEKEIAARLAAGEPLDESMLTLAGLRRVEYVFVYPDSNDLAIAGPAGDWMVTDERRLVATDTGLPVVRLDDLATLLRRDAGRAFGCSIDPRPESLAAAQQYLNSHAIPPGKRARDRWLEEVRARVGLQDLSYRGLSADSRVACVLGEADYHMKLIGMGLADGTAGMKSYLDTIEVKPSGAAPAMGAVRWWFEMNYAAIETSEAGDAFKLVGQGVKLLSENEAIAAHGGRRPTGTSDQTAQAFAASFTSNFSALCEKYAVYAELRNLFDLALVGALIQTEGLSQQAGWSPGLLQDAQRLPLPRYQAPTTVETAANLRVVKGRQVLAQVSGGVLAQPRVVLKERVQRATEYGPVTNHTGHTPRGESGWWWDVAP